MRIRKALAALVMAILALVVAPSAADAAGGAANGGHTDFSAQARSAGLSGPQAKALQDRVDGYLAKTHGAQIGANKIALDNGVLLLALPGEQRARDLAVQNAPSGAAVNCAYTYVCAYSGEDFTGDEMILFTCNHLNRIYWSGTGSWINNQRSTLYARFYDSNGNLGWTSPGGYSEDRHAPWGWVWWLSPC
ncbi:peptidase inhibitor family I36 protein [Streptomyces sp. TLI_146]|uniref:peptidase inhibitor family I36 protein n=1 Tax=Streptomyces sp. TLI_146 TaxID=1938858 RepID=UPI000CB06319|nr:peptidase inhibitor family I36 protein [Streptomyces sp. TLI_146]PKV89953.1 peptidase inhibitor family I36 [Streptomyces sp. TLI_146]